MRHHIGDLGVAGVHPGKPAPTAAPRQWRRSSASSRMAADWTGLEAGPSLPEVSLGSATGQNFQLGNEVSMRRLKLVITSDFLRLSTLIESPKRFLRRDREHLDALEQELSRAEIVGPDEVPANVVMMNSRVRVTDLDTGAQTVYTLSFPRDANVANNRISVLAPIGTALLGYRTGAVIQAEVRRGKRRLRIDEVTSPAARQLAA